MVKKNKFIIDKEKTKLRLSKIIPILQKNYPQAQCRLIFKNPLELLISTILAAQCTDDRVNLVTAELYKKYRSPQDWASSPISQIEDDIRSTGFFRNKAKNIQTACQLIIDKYDSKVPDTMQELIKLPGVGRKTANVLLGNVFNTQGIVCDTHVIRLSRRLQLSVNKDPVKLEFDLMEIVPKNKWTDFSHLILFHGRGSCKARKPDCDNCCIAEFCPSKNNPELW